MKKIYLVFFLILMITKTTHAQVTSSPNTYYIIPPTNGCNGVWAVQSPQNCNAVNYSITPFGCAVISGSSGDTLFLDLCSIPCDLVTINDSGTICMICWLIPATGLNDVANNQSGISISLNSSSHIITISGTIDHNEVFSITNSLGQSMLEMKLNPGSKTFDIPVGFLSDGVYFWNLLSNGKLEDSGKFLINK